MALAENIKKYREKNGMTQDQLAEALVVSRQSISKWELGQNLPSIDNLISLSGLLDISLDELITGESYLHFPYNYGKPTKAPAMVLGFIIVFWMLMGLFGNILLSIFLGAIFYLLIVWMTPFDFKRYYDYWSLEKKGIRYLKNNQEVYSSFDNIRMPILALLHIRPTEFVEYKHMKRIEIKVRLQGYQPKKTVGLGYAPGVSNLMNESFVLEITTKDDKKIYLDLKQYYWEKSSEHQMLPTIISFLSRKNVDFIDNQGIAKLISNRDVKLIDELYELRDKKMEL